MRGSVSRLRLRQTLLAALVLLAALGLFHFEIVFLGRTMLPMGFGYGGVMGYAGAWGYPGEVRPDAYHWDRGASSWQIEPQARVVAEAFGSGRLPLWNPYQGLGAPLAANAQSGAFDLLRLPVFLSGSPVAWDMYYVLRSALGLALMALFARSVGLGVLGRLAAAVAYTFSGFMAILGNNQFPEIYLLLPGILWGTELLVSGRRRRAGLLLVSVAVALSTLAGMPESTLMTSLYAALYGAWRLGEQALAGRSPRSVAPTALLLLVAWLAGIGLAGPLVVPLAEYIRHSFNIHTPEQAMGLRYHGLRDLAYFGIPFIQGLPGRGVLAGEPVGVRNYAGSAVLLLATVGALSLGRDQVGRLARFALAALALFGAKVFGVPLVNELGRLPPLDRTLVAEWGTPLLSCSLALLAGVGVHRIACRQASKWAVGGALLLLATYLAASAVAFADGLRAAGPTHVGATVGVAALAGASAWLVLLVGPRLFRSHWAAAAAAGLIAAGELLYLAPHGVFQDRYDSLARPPFVEALQRRQTEQGPFRVLGGGGLLFPNTASAFGLGDLRSVDGLYPDRYRAFIDAFIAPIYDRYTGQPSPGGEGETALADNPWLNAANVGVLVMPAGTRDPTVTAALAREIADANGGAAAGLRVDSVTLLGQTRRGLAQPAPGEARYFLVPDQQQARLDFSVAAEGQGGAQVTVLVEDGAGQQALLALRVGTDSPPTGWVDGTVDLRPYLGQPINLVLRAEPLPGAGPATRVMWADLALGPTAGPSAQFERVYDAEVTLFANAGAGPRASLVPRVIPVADRAGAVAAMRAPGFDPTRAAVVETAAPDAFRPSPDAETAATGDAVVRSYAADRVEVSVRAPGPRLLVLADVFYPGWKARVDGREVPIYATNLAFRGVPVEAGERTVVFSYEPGSFTLGVSLAVGAALLLVGTLAALGRGRTRETRSRVGSW